MTTTNTTTTTTTTGGKFDWKDSGKCNLCHVIVGSNRKQRESHFMGKKHRRSLPKSIMVIVPDDVTVEDIQKYFENFGSATSRLINPKTIEYRFRDPDKVTEVIQKKHFVYSKELTINWFGKSNNETKPNTRSNIVIEPKDISTPSTNESGEEICKYLENLPSFSHQVQTLYSKLKTNEKELEDLRNMVLVALRSAVTRKFPHCKIQPFGSSVTGLDYGLSDLDICLNNLPAYNQKTLLQNLTLIKTLISQSKQFSELYLIKTAKVPIIKCKHIATNMKCDIGTNNVLGVYNSNLIKYYLGLDKKLKPLMMFIKFLFKTHDFVKNTYFTSYSLTIMFIFSLQQSPYNLPSVKDLSVDGKIECGWNSNFEPLKNFNSLYLQNATSLALFTHFLKFYINFNYFDDMICPYLGKTLKRSVFYNIDTIPDCLELYKKTIRFNGQKLPDDSLLVIQDPFQHDRNITINTQEIIIAKFVMYCNIFLDTVQKGEKNLIYSLLNQKITKQLEYNLIHYFNISNKNIENNFCKKVMEQIFQEIFKMDVNEQLNAPLDPSDAEPNFQTLFLLNINGNYDYCSHRLSIFKKIYSRISGMNSWQQHLEITKEMNVQLGNLLALNVRGYWNRQTSTLKCKFSNLSSAKTFLLIVFMIKMKYLQWLEDFNNAKSPPTNSVENNVIIEKSEIKIEKSTEMDKNTGENENKSNIIKLEIEEKHQDSSCILNPNPTLIKSEPIICDTTTAENSNSNKTEKDLNISLTEFKSKINNVPELDDVGDTNNKQQQQDEVDDVPDDFFDDFSNADFMEGLDIVDDWHDNPISVDKTPVESIDKSKEKPKEKSEKKESKPKELKSKDSKEKSNHSKSPNLRRISKSPNLRRSSRSPNLKRRSRSPRVRRYKDKIQESPSRRRKSPRRSSELDRHRDLKKPGLRRDLEKTKRDISRDKLKVARDQEIKVVNEKLRLVETGLVPPGTEMEADITMLNTTNIELQKTQSIRTRIEEHYIAPQIRSQIDDYLAPNHTEFIRESQLYPSSRSPHKSRSIHDADERQLRHSNTSNISEREAWLRSNRKRSRSSSKSRRRIRSRSRDLCKRKRSSRSPSPLRRKKRSRSHDSPRRRSRDSPRNRSRDSPRRRSIEKLTKRKQDIAKKKSFLEEIREKLNEISVPNQYPQHQQPQQVVYQHVHVPVPVPVPAPAPVPNPSTVVESQQYYQTQQYDQSFFIGDYNPHMNLQYPTTTTTQNYPNVSQSNPIQQQQSNLTNVSCVTIAENNKSEEKSNNEDIANVGKLFADKKISLSDFLTITAKPEVQSSTPENIQRKVKVISRCQDVIKMMSQERKFPTQAQILELPKWNKNNNDIKYKSPLRKLPNVRYNYTTPPKSTEPNDLCGAIDKVLKRIGLLNNKTIDFVDLTINNSKEADNINNTSLNMNKNVSSCEECKKRKQLVYVTVGTQCETNEKISIETQVCEEDLNIVKQTTKESLAALTPAQLLEKAKEVNSPLKKRAPTPPPAIEETSQEKNKQPSKPPPSSSSAPPNRKGRKPPPPWATQQRRNPPLPPQYRRELYPEMGSNNNRGYHDFGPSPIVNQYRGDDRYDDYYDDIPPLIRNYNQQYGGPSNYDPPYRY